MRITGCSMLGLLLWIVSPAALTSASPITWYLDDVTFGACTTLTATGPAPCLAGGTASGYFVLDADARAVSDWSITTSGGDIGVFPSFGYDLSTSTARLEAVDIEGHWYEYINFIALPGEAEWGAGIPRQLRLGFRRPLTDAGGNVRIDSTNPFAGECYNCAPVRLLAGGRVRAEVSTAVPEPASLLLLGTGLAAAFLVRRRRP